MVGALYHHFDDFPIMYPKFLGVEPWVDAGIVLVTLVIYDAYFNCTRQDSNLQHPDPKANYFLDSGLGDSSSAVVVAGSDTISR